MWKNEIRPLPHTKQKLTQNDLRPKYKNWNYRTLEKNIDINLCDVGLGYNFWNMTQKAHAT